MSRCHEHCLLCPYKECINDRYGPDVLKWVIAIEKLAGVYLPEDALVYEEELLEAAVVRDKQIKAKKRKKQRLRFSYTLPPKEYIDFLERKMR